MTSLHDQTSPTRWRERIEGLSERRCDLDVLLKEQWRHTVAIRDDGDRSGSVEQQSLVVAEDAYSTVQRLLDEMPLAALGLITLHIVLDAYGHGSQTVVAYLDGLAGSAERILPVIVDHSELAGLTGMEAMQRLAGALAKDDSYSASSELLQLGLFDAALLVTDRVLDPAELPAFPLLSVIHRDEVAGRLRWTLYYDGKLFDAVVIGGLLEVAQVVLGQLAGQPDRLVGEIELISSAQKAELARFNDTAGDFPTDTRLEHLVEQAGLRAPDRDAVVLEDRRLSYRELSRRSNQFAHWLIGPAVGLRPNGVVALCLDKSELGVIVALGIWKAGAAYVHLDPTYPSDYLRDIMGDTQPAVVLASDRHVAGLSSTLGRDARVFAIERVLGPDGEAANLPPDQPELALTSAGLAYISYTSGTTGVPKGVPKDHASVVNSITDLSERYDMRRHPGEERVALYASYVFEPHMRQTLIALINCQTVVIVPDSVRLDPEAFPAYLARHQVSYLNATGSVLQHFDLRGCSGLKKILLVGEELTSSGLRRLRETFTGLIINEYAFTEAAFVTAIKEFPPGQLSRTDRSIGRPLRNVTWYVLSQDRKQLPIGAIGELYIGGCGVARGYLNRPELTAERFFANPFRSERDRAFGRNERIYRTGDLARMLPTGEVEYLGRSDFQLKLNGVRVEPGEIETRAMEFPGVRKCVVVARQSATGDRHLVGYYTTEARQPVPEAELLAFLEQRLVRVMVPARMMWLSRIPVNVNGKVDLRALPPVDVTKLATDPIPVSDPPSGVLDTVRRIWGDVLGLPAGRIQPADDFFRLGGQSITCILMIARIRQQLRLAVGVDDLFRLRTLGRLAELLQRRQDLSLDGEPTLADSAAAVAQDRMLANGLQQGLLYQSLKNADSDATDDAYVMQSVYRYRSRIDPALMQRAWQAAQRKYPGLRLRFEPGADPVQVVGGLDTPLHWSYIDLSDISSEVEQQARIRTLHEHDRTDRYRLTEGGLFRVHLIKQRDELFTLIFSCHHVIMDGWSLPVLHDEVHRSYLRLLDGQPLDETEDLAYYAAQQYWAAHRNDHTDYWTSQIEQIEERGDLTGLLNESSRYKVGLDRYDRVLEHRTRRTSLDRDRTAALAAACAAHEVTVHSVLQFVWHKVLHAIGGGRTTVVGTIVSGRNLPVDGIESSVGLYINTLPLIIDHQRQAGQRVTSALADIQATVNTMNGKSTVELGRIGGSGMKRRLFDTLLVLENYPRLLAETEEHRHGQLLRFEKDYDADKVDYPMAVVAREESGELTINIWYAGELFDDDAIETLLETTRTVFDQVIADMDQPVAALEFVSPAMIERFDAWNETQVDFPAEQTLHGLFEDMAARWPDETALVYRDLRLTYRQLNERANQLAHYLRSQVMLSPGDLLALLVDKSELMFVAILAVWKTGAAYVPIDPKYPDDRVAFMLSDTNAKLILTSREYGERLRRLAEPVDRPVLELDRLQLAEQPVGNPAAPCLSTDLAYAIYTSGTTGLPKAVLVEHIGVVNLQTSLSRRFRLSKADSDEAFLSFSNYVFDHFVEQMTDALLNGQTLVVLDDSMRTNQDRLCRYINDNRVTYLSGTPSVLSLYDFSATTSLTRVDAIGEDFTEPVFDKIRRSYSGEIINGYGPTEISITSHKRPYPPGERRTNKSIGFLVDNYTAYVLAPGMKRVPVGGVGELYIGGVGVARGYLNRPELTEDRFLDNPFQTARERQEGRNARIYKTGDLARWLPNGEVECLGRTDFQVKIRGLRAELGELEAVLSSYPGISRSLVITREYHSPDAAAASGKYLVGFYLSDRELDEDAIKRYMRTKLAEQLVPARLLRIDNIPVTASGKLDSSRLPATDFSGSGDAPYVAPSDDIEIKLCGIWSTVLGLPADRISVQDDFFTLGGDSIRAMALAQAVTSSFAHEIGLGAVFKHTTLAAQAAHIRNYRGPAASNRPGPTGAAGQAGPAPVSLAQERLLFIDAYEGGSAAYNVPFTLRIDIAGRTLDLASAAIAGALGSILRRHPALRTLLRPDSSGIQRQHVLPEQEALARFQVPTDTVPGTDELDRALLSQADYVFQLGQELPIRARLYRRADRSDVLYLAMVVHHSCFDGWSRDILLRELSALLAGAEESELPPVTGSYADYAVWQRQYLVDRRRSELLDFWATRMAGFQPVRLPECFPRPAQFDYRGREIWFDLDEETVEQLRALARSARVSLFSVLLAAWYLMLRLYTGQDDLVVGTPMANRGRPEFNEVIGLFVNTIVLRTRIDPAASLTEYLASVGAEVLAAQVHGELPFEQLVKELAVEADPSRQPVAQVSFTLENGAGAASATDLVLRDYIPAGDGRTTVKFDVSLMLRHVSEGLLGSLTYAESIFDHATAESFLSTFRNILAEFCRLSDTAASARLTDIGWTSEPGRPDSAAMLGQPGPIIDALGHRSLHAVFESVVQRWSDDVALVCGDVRLTYRELNERANRLAHQLRECSQLRPDDLIALVLDKSELTVIAILATWKAGAAYLPIDPSCPDERISFMLEDGRARLVLANDRHAPRLRGLLGRDADRVLAIEELGQSDQPVDNPALDVMGSDLAYAIYTSGTTGRPKAVLVEHQNVLSLHAELQQRYFGPATEQRQGVLFLSNYSFDFSVEQLILSILSGHKLIVCGALPDEALYRLADQEQLSYLSGTPTQLQQFDLSRLPHLRTVLVAGEVFHPHHFNKIRREFAGPLYNAYGTTETTVYNTVHQFRPGDSFVDCLGEPLGNTRVHVLGDQLQPLPAGAAGQLHLAGDCVSRGYLNRRELDRERFIANPLQTEEERRAGRNGVLYRTGDLVRQRPDGTLQFLGRNDAQVKIRGLRIELGEIEAALAGCPGVRQCAVLVRDDVHLAGVQRLVGYYVPRDATVTEEGLLAALHNKLLPAMVPSRLVAVEGGLPMTISGKLDEAALPPVEITGQSRNYVAPRNRTEARLCELWSAQLPGTVGIDDDFFRSGGDSIGALHLASRAERELGRSVSVKQILDHRTVRKFADNVLSAQPDQPAETKQLAEQGRLTGPCPMLPIQDWFFAKPLAEPHRYNQNFAIRTPRLDLDTLRAALARLVDYHDGFRLRYRRTDSGMIEQRYDDAAPGVVLHNLDVSGRSTEDVRRALGEWQRGFDLDHGPLACAAYLDGFADGSARIWFAVHHLIVDAVSWRILVRDLEILYHGGELGTKSGSYRQWADAVRRYQPDPDEAQLWSELATGVTNSGAALLSPAASAAARGPSSRLRFVLGQPETASLLTTSNQAYDTEPTDLLLAGLGVALGRITGQDRSYVTVEGHGREQLDGAPDIRDTVGWFTTMYPLAIESGANLAGGIQAVRQLRRRIPRHGLGYGALRGRYGAADSPLPPVSLNYLGRFADSTADAGWQLDVTTWADDLIVGGQSASESLLDITMSCIGGQLVVVLDSYLEGTVTSRLAEELRVALEQIIAHTSDVATGPGAGAAADFEPYVLIEDGNPDRPLFVLPPGEGGAESYISNIAGQLSGHTMVLFNNRHLHTPAASIEELAGYYVKHIRRLQPEGPYHLLGWSFGGIVALEIASQLAGAGERIENLLIIDSYFNMRKAAAEIGMPDKQDILDPINYWYQPTEADLRTLHEHTGTVVLFRAAKVNDVVNGEAQRRLFDYYFDHAPYHDLDTLLPSQAIQVELLAGETHHSWARNPETVRYLSSRISELLAAER